MNVKTMDQERVEINNIKNIKQISIRDFGQSYVDTSKTSLYNELFNDGTLIIPSLWVVYEGGSILLYSTDKNFNYLVKKVREVYLQEKDKPCDEFGRYINIDERTKSLLLSDTLTKMSDLYSFYDGLEGYHKQLLSMQNEVHGLLPLLEYIIDSNLKQDEEEKDFKLEDRPFGCAPIGKFVLQGKISGKLSVIPVQFKRKGNNTYIFDIGNNIFDIGNVQNGLHMLHVEVSFNKASFNIVSQSDSLDYLFIDSFQYVDGTVINSKEVYAEDKCVISDSIVFDKLENAPSLSKIDQNRKNNNNPEINQEETEPDLSRSEKREKLDWFLMPWGAHLGYQYDENPIDENQKTVFMKVQYIDTYGNTFINIESAEKRYVRKSENFKLVKDIVYDDVDKTMVGYYDGDLTYIETNFSSDGAMGEYKDKFAEQYFYHVSEVSDFSQLTPENIHPVSREDGVYRPGDLLLSPKVKSLAKEV